MKSILLKIGLFILLISQFSLPIVQAETTDFAADHVLAVEVETGKILYEKDATDPTYIASITKLLTVYLVYQAIEKGELTLKTPVPISDYAYNLTVESAVSNVNLDNRSYTVEELLTASLVSSANSAAIALAEKVAGSEPAFVDLMRKQVKKWGIKQATLVNATGLDNSFLGDNRYPGSGVDEENKLSARAIATITRHLLLDYPQVLDITNQYSHTIGGNTYYTTNQMLPENSYGRAGVDGLKTGTSDKAGASFVATSEQNNMRIITVVLHATDGETEPDNRFVVTNQLMAYVYDQYSLTSLVNKGERYHNSRIPIFNGQTETTPAVAKQDLKLVIKKYAGESYTARFTGHYSILDAPVKKGTVVGTLQLTDQNSDYLDKQPTVQMIIPKTIHPSVGPVSWWNHFVRYVNEKL